MGCGAPTLSLRRMTLLRRATRLFGGEPAAQRWIDTPLEALHGAAPYAAVQTQAGYEAALLVLDCLDVEA